VGTVIHRHARVFTVWPLSKNWEDWRSSAHLFCAAAAASAERHGSPELPHFASLMLRPEDDGSGACWSRFCPLLASHPTGRPRLHLCRRPRAPKPAGRGIPGTHASTVRRSPAVAAAGTILARRVELRRTAGGGFGAWVPWNLRISLGWCSGRGGRSANSVSDRPASRWSGAHCTKKSSIRAAVSFSSGRKSRSISATE